jgi:cell division protein FtsI/penicillin-binding protein 2
MHAAARTSPEARVVVLRLSDGRIVAARHLQEASVTLAAPGSTLKPIILYQLLKAGLWSAGRRIPCPGDLHIGGRRLACSHPVAPPLDGRDALAWSCNAYFAQATKAIPAGGLAAILQPTGLLGSTGLENGEALAEFTPPKTPEETQLAVLGVDGIRVTPLELAEAYRWLAQELNSHQRNEAADAVRDGLMASTSYGMAKSAHLRGASVMGKTGTAEGAVSGQAHGWFVGLTPAEKPEFVVVVYLPLGHGSDSARIAGELLAHTPEVSR